MNRSKNIRRPVPKKPEAPHATGNLIPPPSGTVDDPAHPKCIAEARAASTAQLEEAIDILQEQIAELRLAHPHFDPFGEVGTPGYKIGMLEYSVGDYRDVLAEKRWDAARAAENAVEANPPQRGKATVTTMPTAPAAPATEEL